MSGNPTEVIHAHRAFLEEMLADLRKQLATNQIVLQSPLGHGASAKYRAVMQAGRLVGEIAVVVAALEVAHA